MLHDELWITRCADNRTLARVLVIAYRWDMMSKSLRQLLDDMENDLLLRMDPLRKELGSMERELADVRRAKGAISETEGPGKYVVRGLAANLIRSVPVAYGGGEARNILPPPSPYAKLTMKQLVRKALDEHFGNGATANELQDFFRDAWGRDDIVRTSLSPQLSRLKREGFVTLIGMKWHLVGMAPTGHDEAPAKLPLDAPDENEASTANTVDASETR